MTFTSLYVYTIHIISKVEEELTKHVLNAGFTDVNPGYNSEKPACRMENLYAVVHSATVPTYTALKKKQISYHNNLSKVEKLNRPQTRT